MTAPDHKFHRWVDPGERSAPKTGMTVEANEAERQSLAKWLDVPAVRRFVATLDVLRRGADTAAVTGTFTADLDLVCGVSLDEFPETISGAIDATFRKDAGSTRRPAELTDVEINLEHDEPGEWLVQGVDLGALLAEELSLALPDFPRKPGVEPVPLEDTQDDEVPNPFAALARLKGEAPPEE